jgi:hypothetical protein
VVINAINPTSYRLSNNVARRRARWASQQTTSLVVLNNFSLHLGRPEGAYAKIKVVPKTCRLKDSP